MRMQPVLVCLCLSVLSANIQAQKTATPGDRLQQSRPSTNWNSASARTADVDCDGQPDTVMLGSEKGKVVVGVVWGKAKQPQLFVFPIGRDQQDAFCVAPTKIDIAPLDCESDQVDLP